MRNFQRQSGFTLTELMITVALSLSVISAVLVGYLGTYSASMDTLASSKVNQDLSALMNLMVSDIRRTGYSADSTVASTPTSNIFNVTGITALEVYDSVLTNNQVSPTGSGSCIVYAYDRDEDGGVDADELSGFRLIAGIVQMRTVGNILNPDTCSNANNTWADLTDSGLITVTALTFDLAGSTCLNTREPDNIDNDANGTVDNAEEADCYDAPTPALNSGNITVETRQVTITLTGNLTGDAFVRQTQTQNVRVRNDLVRIR
jgi:prepilin peptidase dependent protein B